MDGYCIFFLALLGFNTLGFYVLHRRVNSNREDINLIAKNPAKARRSFKHR